MFASQERKVIKITLLQFPLKHYLHVLKAKSDLLIQTVLPIQIKQLVTLHIVKNTVYTVSIIKSYK